MKTNGTIDRATGALPWRRLMWGGIAGLLALPLVAMQFTDEVQWGPEDFLAMGIMLGTVGAGMEVAVRMSRNLAYRMAFALSLAAGFLLLWINLAVGIIGSDDDAANGPYAFVLMIAMLGSLASLFRPRGMAWSMAVAGVMQAVVPVLAWVDGAEAVTRPEVGFLTVFFCGMWGVAAALFFQAAREGGVRESGRG